MKKRWRRGGDGGESQSYIQKNGAHFKIRSGGSKKGRGGR